MTKQLLGNCFRLRIETLKIFIQLWSVDVSLWTIFTWSRGLPLSFYKTGGRVIPKSRNLHLLILEAAKSELENLAALLSGESPDSVSKLARHDCFLWRGQALRLHTVEGEEGHEGRAGCPQPAYEVAVPFVMVWWWAEGHSHLLKRLLPKAVTSALKCQFLNFGVGWVWELQS